jgi:hypothetical protein
VLILDLDDVVELCRAQRGAVRGDVSGAVQAADA